MTRQSSIGEQELELLRFISEHGPLSAAEVAEQYGDAQGLARTTIHTMLERLRHKGYLSREKQGGVFRYAAVISRGELQDNLIGQFLQRTLGGSVTPLAVYLANASDLSEEEIQALKAAVARIDARRKGEGRE